MLFFPKTLPFSSYQLSHFEFISVFTSSFTERIAHILMNPGVIKLLGVIPVILSCNMFPGCAGMKNVVEERRTVSLMNSTSSLR